MLGNRLTEDLTVLQDAIAVRVQSRHDRIATRTAQWKGAVGPVEADTSGSELVEVRCFGKWIPRASQPIVQIVGDDEKDIATRLAAALERPRDRWDELG